VTGTVPIEEGEKRGTLWLWGALCFALAGLSTIDGVLFLFLTEGPGSPDILTTLASPNGQQQLLLAIAGLAAGPIFGAIGFAILFSFLRRLNFPSAIISLSLATISAGLFVVVAAFHYSLVSLAKEGFTADNGLRLYSVAAHYFGDVGGWAGIAGLALSTLLVSLILARLAGWKLVGYFGVAIAVLAVFFFLMDASYLFLIPFSVWLLVVSIAFFMNRKTVHT
jgi:hypothetical protein